MKEKIFNLFLYMGDNNVINQIGVAIHEITGSDSEKLNFLEGAVSSDLESSKKFPIPANFTVIIDEAKIPGITYNSYMKMCSMGTGINLFEDIFEHYTAPNDPLICVTPVVNGIVTIKGKTGM